MMMKHVMFAAALAVLTATTFPASAAENPKSPAPSRSTDALRSRDDVSELRPHEQHVYRRDMAECNAMERVERQLCQRSVRSKARAKIRRRAH